MHGSDATMPSQSVDDGSRDRDEPDADDSRDDRLPALATGAPTRQSRMIRYEDIPVELAEALRGIVNRFELRTGSPLPKSVAVTSALSGEGVTTSSQALATLIAQEMGSFVCWVDCSWLSRDAGPNGDDDHPSLTDILANQSRILSAFESSQELPQLMSLQAARVPERQRNTIVRSPEFERLLTILAEEFDHVVFDIPAVLANTNGLALMRRSDASLLVVRHRATSITQVRRALEATHPTPNLGVLLNRFESRIPVRLRRLLGD
jgi:Mrp family chromosome partitioning ATPase